jgi:hypothetical protein
LPEEWKESVVVPIYKKDDKTDCRNISLLSTAHKILSSILLSMLTPCPEEINVDHQCGFRRNTQLLIVYSIFVKFLREKGNTMQQTLEPTDRPETSVQTTTLRYVTYQKTEDFIYIEAELEVTKLSFF